MIPLQLNLTYYCINADATSFFTSVANKINDQIIIIYLGQKDIADAEQELDSLYCMYPPNRILYSAQAKNIIFSGKRTYNPNILVTEKRINDLVPAVQTIQRLYNNNNIDFVNERLERQFLRELERIEPKVQNVSLATENLLILVSYLQSKLTKTTPQIIPHKALFL